MDDECSEGDNSKLSDKPEFSSDDEWPELWAGIQDSKDDKFVRPDQDFEF